MWSQTTGGTGRDLLPEKIVSPENAVTHGTQENNMGLRSFLILKFMSERCKP